MTYIGCGTTVWVSITTIIPIRLFTLDRCVIENELPTNNKNPEDKNKHKHHIRVVNGCMV